MEVSDYLCPAVEGTGIAHKLVKHPVLGTACHWCGRTEEELLKEVAVDGVPTTTMVKPPVF